MLRKRTIPLTLCALLGALLMAPAARADSDASLSVSVGSGWATGPTTGRVPTSIMVAPGLNLLGDNFLRVEVGFVADMPDIRDGHFDMQVRPMLVLTPPILPIYGRLVSGVTQLVKGPLQFAFGGVVGLEAPIGSSTHLFAEAGYVPRVTHGDFLSVFEGRLGLRFGF